MRAVQAKSSKRTVKQNQRTVLANRSTVRRRAIPVVKLLGGVSLILVGVVGAIILS